MGGFFSPSPATGSSSGTSTTTYTPSPYIQGIWNDIVGTAAGLTTGPGGIVNNYVYPGQMVAQPGDLMSQYWGQAGQMGAGAPNVSGAQNTMGNISGDIYNTQVDPSGINLPQFNAQSFQPGQLNIPSFGATPNVTAPQGPSGLASSYLVNPGQVQAPTAYTPQQVSAERVSAPGAIRDISGIQNVNAPTLQNYQMSGVANVNAPTLKDFQMQAAANVSPGQSWTDPGVAAQFMSPYTQQVVNTQLAQAKTQEQQQLQQQGAQAAQAGAFGGSRQAVEAANTSIGYQQLAANLQAQGLQNAYQQGTQQFNTQQGLAMQAALANQQAQQQANVQNLSSFLQTQGLGAQTGLSAALANQQAGLTVGQANLGANLQTQGLGAQLNMQGQLANQQMNYQTQLANQQAQEFGYGQQLQASLANQQTGLQAAGMNQQAGLQAGLANMGYQFGASQANAANALQAGLAAQQLGFQGAQYNAGNQMQAQLANQAAQMQGLGMTYQGGLQGALQTQNLGLSGAEFGGQLGAQMAQNQYGLQQAQQGLNMQAMQGSAGLQQAAANLGLTGYQTGLQGLGALQQGATSQQGYQQARADAAYQQWINSMALPMQGVGWLAQIAQGQPLPYTMQNQYSGTTTNMPYQPSGFSQAIQGAISGLGAIGGIFGLAKGGPVTRQTGLAAVRKRPTPVKHGLGYVM